MYFNSGDLVFPLVVITTFVSIHIKTTHINDTVLWFLTNISCTEHFIVLILLKTQSNESRILMANQELKKSLNI